MSAINQKEYLKKYLGIGKDKKEKKKKKKPRGVANGLKIVDDNIDINQEIQEDLAGDNEDAPQIVSIIDDRPPSLRVDEVSKSFLWTPVIGSSESQSSTLRFESTITLAKKQPNTTAVGKNVITSNQKPINSEKQKEPWASNESSLKIKQENISEESSEGKSQDYSPPRRRKRENSPDLLNRKQEKLHESPLKKRKGHLSGDLSPPRKSNDDLSPRKIKSEGRSDLSPRRQNQPKILDQSPPRKKQEHSGDDLSPPRKATSGSKDISPLRRRQRKSSTDLSPKRWKDTRKLDLSPQRKWRERREDHSPPRNSRNRHDALNRHRDSSPHRRNRSPNRLNIALSKTSGKKRNPSRSPGRTINRSSSPVRKIKSEKSSTPPPKMSKKSRWEESSETESKLTKTLDGKKAGLQNAMDLMQETRELKRREDELFKNMSASVSGANAATVHRGKKKEVNWEAEEKKRKKEEESKEKYYAWGRGLKQVDDVTEKIKNELYEMSKPLARYADDEDLERYLKEQERAGDPMLAYFKNKKKTLDIEEGKPVKQQYEGDAPPNRFGIRPGYRWDGVDRSNGYEKEWFTVQNSKTASVEEVYKWSTEDM